LRKGGKDIKKKGKEELRNGGEEKAALVLWRFAGGRNLLVGGRQTSFKQAEWEAQDYQRNAKQSLLKK